jgi:hypothetical protein
LFKNKEILNGWKEIMFFENGSTVDESREQEIEDIYDCCG